MIKYIILILPILLLSCGPIKKNKKLHYYQEVKKVKNYA